MNENERDTDWNANVRREVGIVTEIVLLKDADLVHVKEGGEVVHDLVIGNADVAGIVLEQMKLKKLNLVDHHEKRNVNGTVIVIGNVNGAALNPEIVIVKGKERERKDVKETEVKGWSTSKLMMAAKSVLKKNLWMIIQNTRSTTHRHTLRHMLNMRRTKKNKNMNPNRIVVVMVAVMRMMMNLKKGKHISVRQTCQTQLKFILGAKELVLFI